MTDIEFEKFKNLIYNEFGNYISEDKRATLDIKINKIITKFHPGISSISQYYDALMKANKDSDIWHHFIDYITVHKTNFFRENDHFEYIKENIDKILELPSVKEKRELRVWCAAASSGEEPYSIVITLDECLPKSVSLKFLATDISDLVLEKAIRGEYSYKNMKEDLSDTIIDKYFDKVDSETCKVKKEYQNRIVFRRFNLMDTFSFKNKFDIIFCRNVMIYFDPPTKNKVVSQLSNILNDGGLLILGLSESLGTEKGDLEPLRSSMYLKPRR